MLFFCLTKEVSSIYDKFSELLPQMEDNDGEGIGEINDAVKVTCTYYQAAVNRNRRYLMSYFQHRLTRIRGLRWETGGEVV